ncbi:hypothetical protein L484_001615 [Morus notabilis]|uniref:Uncharacterized protein n=1 Tax=Morus notabilis TaxID=981085 RepID=W9S7F3_9ROSA|nr:hypothetical protein L484_001615 [Morus notabilis]
MGTISTPKLVTVPVAVLEREESFDLTADGHHFDTKTCHRSRGGSRARRELRSNGLWVPLLRKNLLPFPGRLKGAQNLTNFGPRYDTKSCHRSCASHRTRRELRSNGLWAPLLRKNLLPFPGRLKGAQNLTNFGPRYDTKSCRHSCASCRSRRELRSNG